MEVPAVNLKGLWSGLCVAHHFCFLKLTLRFWNVAAIRKWFSKAIILAHWLLSTWGYMALWLPPSYAWGNFTILAVGVWAVAQRDSVDAILMFLAGLLLTILTDIVHISLSYPNHLSDVLRFSTGMAIFSLLLKPLSCFFAYQMYRERGGEYAINLGVLGVASEHSAYQSIDHAEPPRPFPDVTSKMTPPHPY